MSATDPRLQHYLQCYTGIAPERIAPLAAHFAKHGRFVDPFNEVFGAKGVTRVFEHMYATCENVRFMVHATAMDGDVAFVEWTCELSLKRWRRGQVERLEGVSRITFDTEGGVVEHVDYWDAAAQVYARLPLLGALIRWLRGLFAAAH